MTSKLTISFRCRARGCAKSPAPDSKYCRKHSGHELWPPSFGLDPKPYKRGSVWSLTRPNTVWIYFITFDDESVKIGKAKDVFNRIETFSISCPKPFKLLACVESEPDLEFMLHKSLKAYHQKGEWFKKCKAVDLFIELANSDQEQVMRTLAAEPPRL